MTEQQLHRLIDEFSDAGSDFSRIWSVVSGKAADIVEIRHFPPSPQLDGWRSRSDFIAYVEEEARVFPRAFADFHIDLSAEQAGDRIIWNPLSLSGALIGSGRVVDIRFRVELQFADGKLVRVLGSPTSENSKADIVDWLKSVELAGGFNPPPASIERPSV